MAGDAANVTAENFEELALTVAGLTVYTYPPGVGDGIERVSASYAFISRVAPILPGLAVVAASI